MQDVEQRQDVEHRVVSGDPPAVPQRPQARPQVGRRVDDPLRPAGGPGAVEDQAGVVGRGPDARVARVLVDRTTTTVSGGVADLLILKSSRSAFAGFIQDDLTTLPETADRILATSLTATWRYGPGDVDFELAWGIVRQTLLESFAAHDSASVQHTMYAMGEAVLARVPDVVDIHLVMPNKHHLPVDLSPFGLENRNEIFVATDEPFGLIEATIAR